MTTREEMLLSLRAAIEYARKDGGHGWLVMAAFDSRDIADIYAVGFLPKNDDADWPWCYRVSDLPEATP